MIKKTTLLIILCIVSACIKAQITHVEYPSGYLSEEKITQILNNSRQRGVKEWEVQIQNKMLHKRLIQQNNAIANGTFVQRTVTPPQQVNSSACVNPGFEDGTTNGWTFESGFSYNSSTGTYTNLPCPTCIDSSTGIINQIVNATSNAGVNNPASSCDVTNAEPCTNGIDNYGGFSVIPPGGGNNALLLNNTCAGAKMQQAQYTFVVDSSNDFFVFNYAAVLQDGGHPANESPYFEVTTEDLTTSTFPPCAQYTVTATSGNLTGWTLSSVSTGSGVYYKPWTTVGLDLQPAIGHTVTVKFTVADCNQTGHFGYCYIDASCNSGVNGYITPSNPLCAGGSTTLSGPPGFSTYQWYNSSGVITGGYMQNLVTSTPGSYTLNTTSSAGCPAVFTYTLTQSAIASPTVSILASNDTICNGSSTTLTASGADTYIWSTNATTNSILVSPATDITYTVTGTDAASACTNIATQFVHVISADSNISIHASNDSICGGTTTTLIASGATTYTWSNNATTDSISVSPTTNTTYTVTSIDSASTCLISAIRTVYINNAISVQANSNYICAGVIDTLWVTGASTYTWSSNANNATTNTVSVSPISSTVYTVTGIDSIGCISTANINITVVPTPTVSYTIIQDSIPYTWDVYPNYPSNMASVTWYWGDGTSSSTAYPNHTYAAAGSYSICVTVTDSIGCTGSYCQNDSVYRLAHGNNVNSNVIYVNIKNPSATGINHFTANNEQITVYPNPANDMLYINCKLKNASLFVTDVLGNKIKQLNVESDLTSLDISGLSKGVYFLSVKTANTIITKKFIVQR